MKICTCEGQPDEATRQDAARYRAIVVFVERSGAVGFSSGRIGEWTAFVTEKSFHWYVDGLVERGGPTRSEVRSEPSATQPLDER